MRHCLLPLLLFVVLAIVPGAVPAGQTSPRRVVEVTAERFEFWPSEIAVETGEEIELRVTSEDTIHGFRIQGTDTNLIVPKRGKGETVGVFRAVRPGRYTFECSRMCGAGHHFMRGVIVVRDRPAEPAAR